MESKESYSPDEVAEIALRISTLSSMAAVVGGTEREVGLVENILKATIPQNVYDVYERIYLERIPPMLEKMEAETNQRRQNYRSPNRRKK